MARSYDPNAFAHELPTIQRQWAQSVDSVLNGQVDMGSPSGALVPSTDPINAGVYTQFERGNSSGILIRIAGNGVTGTGATYNWGAVNVGIPILHQLQRKPIGFKIVDMDKDVRVYRTAPPDENQITLAPTDNTASVTVYVF